MRLFCQSKFQDAIVLKANCVIENCVIHAILGEGYFAKSMNQFSIFCRGIYLVVGRARNYLKKELQETQAICLKIKRIYTIFS